MQTQVWTSLLGVLLGGGLSYLAQLTAGRQASRGEDRRQASQLAAARRAERLVLLREFIGLAEDGIRIAEKREDADDWEAAATTGWLASARDLVSRLWVCERMIQIQFSDELYEHARAYASAVDQVLWREYDHTDTSMWDHLTQPQIRFLRGARAEIDKNG
jgi:hypothetical protein